MRYELYVGGRLVAIFDSTDAALARAREATRADCETEVDILDGDTKEPAMPAANRSWREHLAVQMGY